MAQKFSTWVIKLAGRVEYLKESVLNEDVQVSAREANKCRAWLQSLLQRAEEQNIDLLPYFDHLVRIDSSLHYIERQIQQKLEYLESKRRPRWAKTLEVIVQSISLVASILGIAPWIPNFIRPLLWAIQRWLRVVQLLLPGRKEQKLLT